MPIPKHESIQEFYRTDAAAYAKISADRDFEEQVSFILANCTRSTIDHVLDAFSGPGQHASAVWRRGIGVLCVDSEPSMKEVACEGGKVRRDDYVVEALPADLRQFVGKRHIGAILVLRYSIGYVERGKLDTILASFRAISGVGTCVFIEVHNVQAVTGHLIGLGIRERVVPLGDDISLVCRWPDGPILWDAEDWNARMLVTMEWRVKDRLVKQRQYLSHESIYSAGDIQRSAEGVGGWRYHRFETNQTGCFPGSELVRLEAI